ncbi:MAG: transposase [Cuniculiplasma sp.]
MDSYKRDNILLGRYNGLRSYIHWIYSQRWNIEIFFRTMKTYLKIDHLISKSINGIPIQIFSALIAYIVLLMLQASLLVSESIPEILRSMRHGIDLPLRANGNHAPEPAKI